MFRTSHITILLIVSVTLSAQSKSDFYNADGHYYNVKESAVAVQGYDVVEYFKSNKAVKGSEKFKYVHDHITYHFSNEENLQMFKKTPGNYLPEYGGYCAYGVGFNPTEGGSKPGKYPINPKAFKITDGKLYLFYQTSSYDALAKWNLNEVEFLKNAERRWGIIHPEKDSSTLQQARSSEEKEKEKEKE